METNGNPPDESACYPDGLTRGYAMLNFTRAAGLCLAIALGATSASAEDWIGCDQSQSYNQQGLWSSQLAPGVSWDAWRILLNRPWSDAERSQPVWFDADRAVAAAAQAPLDTPYPGEFWIWPRVSYVPALPATADQREAYAAAVNLYTLKLWPAATDAFDAIASGPSPYAAAAAYSAARSTFYSSDFTDGFRRIERLVADPARRDMRQAAYHLVGTLANQTGASPLIAARLADIAHLLMVPSELRCRDIELRTLADQASGDLYHIIQIAFPTSHYWSIVQWSEHARGVFLRLAATDPTIDLIRVLAAPTPFMRGSWVDPFFPGLYQYPGVGLNEQAIVAASDPDSAAVTAHARERAMATGNPLWTYALARRTADVADLALIHTARATVARSGIAENDRTNLDANLSSQEARILLMAGRLDLAIAATGSVKGASGLYVPAIDRNGIGDEGARYLLARRDLTSARIWANATMPRFSEDLVLSPMASRLAITWHELLKPGLGRPPAESVPSDAEASALDLLPAARLIELSRTKGLAAGWRRPLLSAGWLRLYMLHRDADFIALFPEIRSAYPELITDLDEIDRAWLTSTKRRLIAHMLLRLPGLSPRVLWARSYRGYGDPNSGSLTAIDVYNDSDGNWWCAIDPDRAVRDTFSQMFAEVLSQDLYVQKVSVLPIDTYRPFPSDAVASFEHIARDWVFWHPLFHDADLSELELLSKVESGPRRLTKEAIDWARHSWWITRFFGLDRDLPETLALAVRATRYGCRRQGPLGDVSEAAWQALHRMFPDTVWAQRTPWWFNEGAP